MMAGNPNWWSISTMHPQSHEAQLNISSANNYHSPPAPPPPPPPPYLSLADHPNEEFPRSWSQLLQGGLGNEQERFVSSPFQYNRKMENWGEEDQILSPSNLRVPVVDVKQETAQTCLFYGPVDHHDNEFQVSSRPPSNSWSQLIPTTSPTATSCLTTLSTSLFNFSYTKPEPRNHQHPENSSHECNSSSASGVAKKPRIQHSSTQPAMKVRKEKLGDRITALHQLVSPFGKTDTASVLSEVIGYIRFLQAQIEALSSPYMGNVSSAAGSMGHQQHSESQLDHGAKDLKSRGLCLVPVSCTQHVGSDNGADYWAPALGGGGGF